MSGAMLWSEKSDRGPENDDKIQNFKIYVVDRNVFLHTLCVSAF